MAFSTEYSNNKVRRRGEALAQTPDGSIIAKDPVLFYFDNVTVGVDDPQGHFHFNSAVTTGDAQNLHDLLETGFGSQRDAAQGRYRSVMLCGTDPTVDYYWGVEASIDISGTSSHTGLALPNDPTASNWLEISVDPYTLKNIFIAVSANSTIFGLLLVDRAL